MNPRSRIGLGTAQFGASYGVSNNHGRPSETEVAAILAGAVKAGFGYLDTAASYADAESLIGRHLPAGHRLRIVTKLPPVMEEVIEAPHAQASLAALSRSLERLQSTNVHGALLHQARDLAKPGWQHLIEALHEAKARGWTSNIGVSVYDAGDLALVVSRFRPDLVQLPFNALDDRFAASGWLHRLKAARVEVHARSTFLQGLLLMDPAMLPDFFGPLQETLANLRAHWAARKLTPVSGCLRHVLHCTEIDAAIVGVNRRHELDEIEAAVAERADDDSEFVPAAIIDPLYLDPRQWPSQLQ